ncbi:MAG: hypothetical protein H6Q66_390 [Firmicutes bacterium]|nr:hypothetical protein [Bacillota bacterium]
MRPSKPSLALTLLFLWIWFFLCSGGSASAADDSSRLYMIKSSNGLYGFINNQGIKIIPPRFTYARNFSDGLAAVQTAASTKWGYIDQRGKFVIAPQFRQAFDFSEGLAAVAFEPHGNIGYIDKTGKTVILPVYQAGSPFHNGIARVQTSTTVFIDKTGAVLLETPYKEAWEVEGGLIAFLADNKMGFMDWQGHVIIEPNFYRVMYGRQDLFKEKITPISSGPFNQNKWGFIDKTGKTVVNFDYDWAEQYQEGMALVCKNKMYGFLDSSGRQVIPLQFEDAWKFSEGLAAVKKNGLWGFIDKQGRWVIPPQYQGLLFGSPIEFHEGLAAVRTVNGTGYINAAGEMVIAPIYRTADDFQNGIAEVHLFYGIKGYINQTGQYIWLSNR